MRPVGGPDLLHRATVESVASVEFELTGAHGLFPADQSPLPLVECTLAPIAAGVTAIRLLLASVSDTLPLGCRPVAQVGLGAPDLQGDVIVLRLMRPAGATAPLRPRRHRTTILRTRAGIPPLAGPPSP